MLTLGVSAGFHDAGLAVVEDGEIVFADIVKDTVRKNMTKICVNQ